MLKADAKRIAWFLGLQRLWHFPRNFMAPPAHFHRGRGIAAPDLKTRGGSVRSSPDEPVAPARSSGFRLTSLPRINRSILPIDILSPAATFRFLRLDAPKLASDLPPWRTISNSAPVTKLNQNFGQQIRNQAAVRQQFLASRASGRLLHGSRDPGLRSGKSMPLAPVPVVLSRQRFGGFERDPYPTSTVTGSDEAAFEWHDFLPGEPSISGESIADHGQSPSWSRDETGENGLPQRGRPRVSTLYIDGSALGRWTVQHLERALGKPATGMTGVDPRATIPRSRVAPF
jgi:hypothetical protein